MRILAVSGLAAAAIFSVVSVASAGPAISIEVLGTTATPAAKVCPQTIKFTFLMRATPAAPIQVTYRFLRSDGGTTPAYNAVLGVNPPGGPGYSPTQYAWTLGGATLPTFTGWVKLQTLTPQNVTSTPSNFTINCLTRAELLRT